MCVSRLSSQVSAYFKDATPESGTLPSSSRMALALILGPARRQALLIDFSRDSRRRWDVGGGCNALCFTDHGVREGQRDWERLLSDSATVDSHVRLCCQSWRRECRLVHVCERISSVTSDEMHSDTCRSRCWPW